MEIAAAALAFFGLVLAWMACPATSLATAEVSEERRTAA